MKKITRAFVLLLLTFTIIYSTSYVETKADTYDDSTPNTSISYKAHVTNIGWQSEVTNGTTAGTTGQNLAMQAIQINYPNDAGLNLKYQVHVSNKGWMDAVNNGEIAGTVGQNLPIEAICIAIKDSTGQDSKDYSVYYRTHVQNKGWTTWTKNGQISSATGQELQIEAIQVCVAKVGTIRYTEMESLVSATDNLDIWYKSHISNVGWQKDVTNGTIAGTTGKGLAMEAIQISYPNKAGLQIRYQAHVLNKGWMDTVGDSQTAGTVGENLPMESICIAIKDSSGKDSTNYSVFYRTHVQNKGWTNWTKDGQISGTVGQALQMEAIQITVAKVGTAEYDKMQNLVNNPEPVAVPLDAKEVSRNAVVNEAMKHLEKPYVYGAAGPNSFDCSGLTSYVYKTALGINIGRTTYDQVDSGISVSTSDLKPGDLIFSHSNHVQIYIGNGKVIHAPHTGDVVRIANLGTVWKARRIIY